MAELESTTNPGARPARTESGVLAAVLAVALAIVTIASHRAHSHAVLLKTEANDRWSFYQSKRIASAWKLGEQRHASRS
jgi:hypothetical protein